MRRIRFLPIVSALLAASLPVIAEQIQLKDGTKIIGHMTALQQDQIEVETAYGKMHLKRADIISINFPENGSVAAPASPVAKDATINVEESLRGTQYVNKTGKFTLTVPPLTANLACCFRFVGSPRSPTTCRYNSLWPSSLQALLTRG